MLDGVPPARLAGLIGGLLEPDPADRPGAAAEVLAALDEAPPAEAAAERFWPTWANPAPRGRRAAGRTTLLVEETAGVLDGGDRG